MAGLSKTRISEWLQCPKRLWLKANRPEEAVLEESQQVRMDAGNTVGDIARSFYENGILIEEPDSLREISATKAALTKRKPIFEATFLHKSVLIRADLLIPARGGYRMVEVKSGAEVKPYYLDDAAIQSWVAKKDAIPLRKVEIAYIDTSFVYDGDGDYSGLLKYEDVTEQIAPKERHVPKWIAGAQATLAGDMPERTTGKHCKEPFGCPFKTFCEKLERKPAKYPVEILPRDNGLAAQLRADGYADLRRVPAKRITSKSHQRVWRITKSGQPELLPGAREAIQSLPFPRYYLDFETISLAVPAWRNTRPYAMVPFQWSCHIESSDRSMKHAGFLSDGRADPRREFAVSLIKVLRKRGAVIVYNASFEGARIKDLANDFPDLAPELLAIVDRVFDLLPLTRDNYYHPDMKGSWSIKAVLPTVAPELAYDKLSVANGAMAQDAFAKLMNPQTTPAIRKQQYEALLEYCERDTLAMVKIAHYFEGIKARKSRR